MAPSIMATGGWSGGLIEIELHMHALIRILLLKGSGGAAVGGGGRFLITCARNWN